MTETRRDDYLDWLWYSSPMSDDESRRIERWVEAHVIAPRQDVVQTVEDRLVSEFTDA